MTLNEFKKFRATLDDLEEDMKNNIKNTSTRLDQLRELRAELDDLEETVKHWDELCED